jgi:transcriptional regulator with XRE-family HTH domain
MIQERLPIPKNRGNSIALDPPARDALGKAMMARGWDNAALALEAGIATGTVSRVRNGHRVRPEVIQRIADAIERTRPDRTIEAFLNGELR